LANFTRTARAEEDLIEIWLYIAEDDQKAADTFLNKIDGTCARLANHPAIGPGRPDLAPELRYFAIGRYLILYRKVSGGIDVVHGARHLPDLI
jgi:toxin ParE1/3/4